MFKTLISIFTLLIIFNINAYPKDNRTAEELYMEGKTCCINQQWREAIKEFEKIIDKFPKSHYLDDAHFWVGYCLEKMPDKLSDAFIQFDNVVNKFPNSPWADDAVIHQIAISEELYSTGKKQYHSFLKNVLNSQNKDIRNRAALALGRLNDKSALPVLENLTSDEDLGFLAKEVIAHLGSVDTSQQKFREPDLSKKTLNLLFKSKEEEQPKEEKESGLFSWLNTLRYEQYKSMLKKDNEWSKEELNDFALWHILDTDKFQEYFVLSNEYDKKEWLRKYWALQDPTPTTPENELKNEFNHRVLYARSHFSAFWNYSHMKYLPDQHLRLGWDHAPWDARGELYIKYGEPDIRSVEGWHTEEWQYFKYGIDFLVKQYMTNIYGNAITGGDLSRQRYGDGFFSRRDNSWIPYFEANYIYKNEIKYEHNYNADAIDDLEMDLKSSDTGITIIYTIPVDEFTENKNGIVNYVDDIVIFNSDFREIFRKSFEREISDMDNDISQKIEIKLPAGDYNFALKINDKNSKKLGIYKSGITVEK
jgi:hypothetical protein